jgi:uncharacterized protein YoaH (UPF0181 family)
MAGLTARQQAEAVEHYVLAFGLSSGEVKGKRRVGP